MNCKKIIGIISTSVLVLMLSITFATSIIPPIGSGELEINDPSQINGIVSNILGYMRWIGYAIAIGMLVFIGIRYIISSADERASMKGMLVKVAIGSCIIVFASSILSIFASF